MNEKILLSICIPTYNRGNLALLLLDELNSIVDKYCGKVEIVISNNGSDRYIEEYDYIARKVSDYITYFRFDSNKGFVHNFNQVIRLSRGKYCLLLSDEDHIVEKGLDYYINQIMEICHFGLIRGATDSMYSNQMKEQTFEAGREAIDGYFLQGNYISGVIYNRTILTNEVIDTFEEKYYDNEAYIAYPHMFLEAYLCLKTNIFKGNVLLIHEGEVQDDQKKDGSIQILPYSTLESRLDQAKGYLDLIDSLVCSNGIKLKMITDVITKTFQLLFFLFEKYESIGINGWKLLNNISEGLKAALDGSRMLLVSQTRTILDEYIDAVYDSYEREYELIKRA